MSHAIEGAEVMCYAVSRAYKESANCRMELNVRLHAHVSFYIIYIIYNTYVIYIMI